MLMGDKASALSEGITDGAIRQIIFFNGFVSALPFKAVGGSGARDGVFAPRPFAE